MKYAFTFVIVIAFTAAILAQTGKGSVKSSAAPGRPKLVVGLVIDQMRFDYVYRFWDKLGNDGFKRMLSEGYNCRNTNYNYVPTFTGPGHASIYTGTTPSVHGIIANKWYDRDLKKGSYCVSDPAVNPVGSNVDEGKRSPKKMLTTTVGDQLHLATNNESKVIGIALKDRSAILPAGHTANGAYWFDDSTGFFITSSFYRQDLPQWLNDFNGKKLAAKYLSQDWNLLRDSSQYTESIRDNNKYEETFNGETAPVFPHKLPELFLKKNAKYGLIRNTPFGNSITEDLAEATIIGENMGKNTKPDFLCVSFSSTDYIGHMYGPTSREIEDTYLRLDQELADFFKFLDSWIGKNNVVVFLTADHGVVETPEFLKDQKIPAGYFDEKKCADSLQKTLIRKYGDTLLSSYSNDQVFLNRKKIAAKGLRREDVQDFVAEFLMGFKGVAACMTESDISSNQYTVSPKKQVQNGFNFRRSGDVCVVLEPGWFGDWSGKAGTTHGSAWNYDTHVPLYWWGWKIKPGSSEVNQDITDIAPTLCMMLNIQFPDGCTGQPITGLLK
ncbi:MAG: alkaline phosphatase family protein [Bacteroidota bacterium]|nr:alkaline phosphatase family protein [Bacteroidota bacterium]